MSQMLVEPSSFVFEEDVANANPNHDDRGRFASTSGTKVLKRDTEMYHYTDTAPRISTSEDRLFPRTISLTPFKGGFASSFGSKLHNIVVPKGTKLLTIDLKAWKAAHAEFNPTGKLNNREVGAAVAKHAKKYGYHGIKISSRVSGFDEVALFSLPPTVNFNPDHDDRGRFATIAGSGAGTKADPVRCGDNLKLALRSLAEGKHVRLDQPEQVATLVKKFAKHVERAVAAGKQAKDIDLCKVSVAGTNLFCEETLGIPRVQMPQMRGLPVPGTFAATLPRGRTSGKVDLSAQFIEHMKSQGIKTTEESIRGSHLRASQNQIVGTRVAQLVTEAANGTRDLREKPIFVTRDNYVVDGHHHWAADIAFGMRKGKDWKIPVHKLDCDIGTALRMANEYTKAQGLAPKSGAT